MVVEKRPGGGIWLLTVQSSESGDAGKSGIMVAAMRNMRRPRAYPNMLSICQNPELSPQGPFIQQL